MTFIFARTVRVKSPGNVFARRFRRVQTAVYQPDRFTWTLILGNGSKVEVPADHLIHFGRSVLVAT